MSKVITLTKTERQLLLYEVFDRFYGQDLETIFTFLPMKRRMLQRDVRDMIGASILPVRMYMKHCIRMRMPGPDREISSRLRGQGIQSGIIVRFCIMSSLIMVRIEMILAFLERTVCLREYWVQRTLMSRIFPGMIQSIRNILMMIMSARAAMMVALLFYSMGKRHTGVVNVKMN